MPERVGHSVVVCECEQDNLHSNWIDRIVVQRPARVSSSAPRSSWMSRPSSGPRPPTAGM